MNNEEMKEMLMNHEQRLGAIERLQAVLSTQLSSIFSVLKWIAGITATIAGALVLDAIRRG